jgi:predicted nucleic acid-binding protein
MAIHLLDTSVLIDALNRKQGRWELLQSVVESGDTLACSVVSVTEIYAGMRSHEASATRLFLERLEHYDVDLELACYAGLLKNEWASRGKTVSVPDVLIAATALLHKLVLMTDNRKDFPMPELVLYPLP